MDCDYTDVFRRAADRTIGELAGRIAELLPAGARILEVGGGPLSSSLASKERFVFSRSDLSTLAPSEVQTPAFDLVFTAGALEHRSLDERIVLLRNLAAQSQKYVLTLVPNQQCYWYWIWRNQKAAQGKWTAGRETPLADLSSLFAAAGLRLVGQIYLGRRDTEELIDELTGIDPALRTLTAEIHRSPLIPEWHAAAWIAALGVVESASQSQELPSCWQPPQRRDDLCLPDLTAALADALASRIGNEAKTLRLETELADCRGNLSKTEETLADTEAHAKLLQEKLDDVLTSRTWQIALKVQSLRKLLVPPGSWRAFAAQKTRSAARTAYRTLRHPPVKQCLAKSLAIAKNRTPAGVRRFVQRHRSGAARFLPERMREYLRSTVDLAEHLRSPLSDRLDEFLRDEVAGNPPRRFFVFFSGTTFTESEGQRPTRLARELARRGVPVLFCYWRWNAAEPPQVAKFPHVFCLPIDEFLRDFAALLADPRLAGLERALMMEFPHPALMEVVNYANAFGWKTIYDAIDDWEEFEKCGQALWYDREFESYLLRNADLATITCQNLLKKLAPDEPERCHLLPNAFEDWAAPRGDAVAAAEQAGGKTTIGYFGHLTSSWFDWPLVAATAEKHPEWSFEIIGYGMDAKIALPANVALLGKVEHALLPAHARRWSAAMIPFKPSRLSEAVDPIKIYEYIALGLPTAVTGMMHLTSYPGVFVAATPQQFEEALSAAVAHRLSDVAVAEFLAENRWSNRVEELLRLIARPDSQSAASQALADTEDTIAERRAA